VRIFVVGATGAVGRRLVQLLVEHGHCVVGTTRSPQKVEDLRAIGVEPALLDVLDSSAVTAAMRRARPEVIVHEATALSGVASRPRRWDQSFALTNRLRLEGTDHLIAAARAAGARRLVAQSFAGWPYARVGGPIKTEEDPLDPKPVPALRDALAAIRHVEAAVAAADDLEGIILRYGAFYGPSTSLGVGGIHFEQIRRRRLLIIEPGTGVWSFVHIDDAATATSVAIERGAPGIYNIVDDDPAPVSRWLPALAAGIGAKPPLRIPRWLGRLVAGEAAVVLMTEARGASNAKAKRVLGWQPSYTSWRDGFRKLLPGSESGRDALPRNAT
jgi:nucleoside-diphosphate-sugar epimerase